MYTAESSSVGNEDDDADIDEPAASLIIENY
jgi:hypothetical protein